MISIYLTLVWFEVLYKDPDSRNNEIFSGEHHLASKPRRFKRHASENLILDLLLFSLHRFPNIMIFKEIQELKKPVAL